MIIIGGYLDLADRADRDKVVAAAAPLQPPTREEPGCRAYSFTADALVDTRIWVYELWDDEPSLAAHFVHPNYMAMREVLRQGTRTATEIEKFRSVISEPVYDDSFTPRADFFTATERLPELPYIVIAGHWVFADGGERDRAIAAGAHLQQATRDDEPGCLAYCFSPDAVDDSRAAIWELWEGQDSVAAHFEHANYFGMRELVGQFDMVGAKALKYGIDVREPVYDETRTARADFFTAAD